MKKEIKEKIIEILERAKTNAFVLPPEEKVPYYADQILKLLTQREKEILEEEKQKWAKEMLPEIQRIMIDNMLGWKSTTKVSTREWKKMIKEIEQKLKKVAGKNKEKK